MAGKTDQKTTDQNFSPRLRYWAKGLWGTQRQSLRMKDQIEGRLGMRLGSI